jgi:uncharacterized heparinase superfamily protein
LFADAADLGPDYNPGHGHADTLTYELALRGHRIVVDTGISTYDECATRAIERSTAAHNSVEIDGQNSSDVWSSFRVARRAKARWMGHAVAPDVISFSAAHDGYRHLHGKPIHRREWRLEPQMLRVTDEIRSSSSHTLRTRIHLNPAYDVSLDGRGGAMICHRACGFAARVELGSWSKMRTESYRYAHGFGITEPATCIVLEKQSSGITQLHYLLRNQEGA